MELQSGAKAADRAVRQDGGVSGEMVTVQNGRGYLAVKRCVDVLGAMVLCLLLGLPMLLIAALIRLDSPGPAIYRQERLGLNGEAFVMYKFRTMHQNAEPNGPCMAVKNDSRCTRVGRLLRLTRLDELPQLWNVLRGEMSLVGPRPERAYFYNQFETDIPDFRNRLLVQQGITGLAQLNGGYDLPPQEKIVYDMEYMQNRSLRLDLNCMLKTVRLFFTHEGAC